MSPLSLKNGTDKTTHQKSKKEIPPYLSELKTIQKRLADNGALALLRVDAGHWERIEKGFGKRIYRHVMDVLQQNLLAMRGQAFRKEDILTVDQVDGNQFFVFLSKKRNEKNVFSPNLEALGERITKIINERVFKEVFPYLKSSPNITVGHSIVIHNPLVPGEQLIQRLMEDSKRIARFQKEKRDIKNKTKLQQLILKEDINIVFQLILDLKNNQVMGYEALTRGPEGTDYENPYFLFHIAKEGGLEFELDSLCRRKGLRHAAGFDPQKKIFINCLPTSVQDPDFKEAYLKGFLEDVKKTSRNVVMEISVFRETLEVYSQMGFSVAVEVSGADFSSLEAIVELQPDFLKLNISMVRGIEKNLLKQEMTRAILSFAQSINTQMIAEGIETREELDTLKRLGVPSSFPVNPTPIPIFSISTHRNRLRPLPATSFLYLRW